MCFFFEWPDWLGSGCVAVDARFGSLCQKGKKGQSTSRAATTTCVVLSLGKPSCKSRRYPVGSKVLVVILVVHIVVTLTVTRQDSNFTN